jgi:hypothetical protein
VIWVVFEAIEAFGQALVIPTILPAIQASLPEKEVATFVGMYSFLRGFGFVWGTPIPGIIFNAQWDKEDYRLAAYPDVQETMQNGKAYHFASGVYRSALPVVIQYDIVTVYVETLKVLWYAAVAFSVVGMIAVFGEKHIALRKDFETAFGLGDDKTKDKDK